LAILAGTASAPGASLCRTWSEGQALGALDSRIISEASGLALSRDRARLYHVNDSGGGPYIYVSDLDGQNLRRLRLDGVSAVEDTEALTFGTLSGESMLIVGDIGDNQLRRDAIELFAIREADISGENAPVFARLSARYPDGPHNAEALAMAPDGALYFFTKSWHRSSFDPAPSRIYRLAPNAWEAPLQAPAHLEFVGSIDLPALATRERAPLSDVVTDASMSGDGSRFLLLTYGYAWEFALDLDAGGVPPTAELERGRDYQLIRLKPIQGKETITYLPGDRSFLYGKEFEPDSKPSELIRLDCLD
jgi:hypothetical protein